MQGKTFFLIWIVMAVALSFSENLVSAPRLTHTILKFPMRSKQIDQLKHELAQEDKINEALLATCLHILTTLARLALKPATVVPLDAVLHTAHLIINAAHAILEEPSTKHVILNVT